MANKVRFGISNFHYAIATVSDVGAVTYGDWVRMPLIVSATPTDDTSESTEYADNIQVYDSDNISGVKVDFEFTDVPEKFLQDVFGYVKNTAGGLMRPVDVPSKYIAVAFQVDGDSKKRIQVYFFGTVSNPSDGDHSTNTDSVTFAHSRFSFNAYPIEIGANHFVSETVDEGEAGYATFFSTRFVTPTI